MNSSKNTLNEIFKCKSSFFDSKCFVFVFLLSALNQQRIRLTPMLNNVRSFCSNITSKKSKFWISTLISIQRIFFYRKTAFITSNDEKLLHHLNEKYFVSIRNAPTICMDFGHLIIQRDSSKGIETTLSRETMV